LENIGRRPAGVDHAVAGEALGLLDLSTVPPVPRPFTFTGMLIAVADVGRGQSPLMLGVEPVCPAIRTRNVPVPNPCAAAVRITLGFATLELVIVTGAVTT